MNPIRRLSSWWRKRQRAIDRRILFPSIRRAAGDRDTYYPAVFLHVFNDPAWKYREEWKDEEPSLYQHMVWLDKVCK